MSSPAVNVLRWSALGLGLFYGITHQASISARDRTTAAQRDWKHKEDTIAKAKAEYARKNAPYDVKTGAVVMDPESPNFDLEKLIAAEELKNAP